MYLEKIPQEDGIYNIVLDIYENSSHSFIDMGLTSHMFRQLTYSEWFNAFQEHYSQSTNSNEKYITKDGIGLMEMKIPSETPRFVFQADSGHSALKFWVSREDEAARGIVYSFLERLIQSPNQSKN